MRLRELAQARPRFGSLRLPGMMRREGGGVNWKRVRRIYLEKGLSVRLTRRRKRASHLRVVSPRPTHMNERWRMDFVAIRYWIGGRFAHLPSWSGVVLVHESNWILRSPGRRW